MLFNWLNSLLALSDFLIRINRTYSFFKKKPPKTFTSHSSWKPLQTQFNLMRDFALTFFSFLFSLSITYLSSLIYFENCSSSTRDLSEIQLSKYCYYYFFTRVAVVVWNKYCAKCIFFGFLYILEMV